MVVVGAILRGMVDEMVLTKTENIWRFSIVLVVVVGVVAVNSIQPLHL